MQFIVAAPWLNSRLKIAQETELDRSSQYPLVYEIISNQYRLDNQFTCITMYMRTLIH